MRLTLALDEDESVSNCFTLARCTYAFPVLVVCLPLVQEHFDALLQRLGAGEFLRYADLRSPAFMRAAVEGVRSWGKVPYRMLGCTSFFYWGVGPV